VFAVMKHYDLMIGIDRHICWPPKSPIPLPKPMPYVTIMILHGIQPLTPMMAKTQMTLFGWTMQRGTDIGPGIPHIGIPSILTPIDILFSSSISYFGPMAYHAEAQPVAAALLSVVNLNSNCQVPVMLPTGLVISPTTHFTNMSLLDIMFGFAMMAVDIVLELVTDKLATVLGKAVRTGASKIGSKLASKTASRTAAKASSKGASKASSKATSKAASKTAGKAAPNVRPGQAAPSARPGNARPGAPGKTPPGGWTPGKTPTTPRPAKGPTLGSHRKPLTGAEIAKLYKEIGFDALMEIIVSMPMSFVHMGVMEAFAQSGIEEFGAPPEGQEG
jgi:hypothetical protein